jgi:tight adherence protein C
MRYAVALLAALAAFLVVSLPRPRPIAARVGDYLRPTGLETPSPSRLAALTSTGVATRSSAAAGGALIGVLLAQGDLFVQGPGRATLPMALLGAATGWLVAGMYRSTQAQRRGRRLRFELPVVADTLALHVIAGESVGTAVAYFVSSSRGVASEEFADVLHAHDEGLGLSEALQHAGRVTSDEEARRLYSLLAHAHDTGGRLADALTELSADYRSALARDLTAEGGKRALATYGPVLVFMVPVTLLFLLYPTLAGLRSLAGSP